MSATLAVLERNRAIDDAHYIRTLVDARTLGDVRAGSQRALNEVRDQYDGMDEREPGEHFNDLPDSLPFSVIDWFGSDYWYLLMPLARLITEVTVPKPVLAEFGQEDHALGLDYEQATWLRPEDEEAVVSRLRELGFEVDDSDNAAAIILTFDYANAK